MHFNRSQEIVLFVSFGDHKVTQYSGFTPVRIGYLEAYSHVLKTGFRLYLEVRS